MTLPVAPEWFVIEPPNQAKPLGPGDLHNVLPLLVSLENVFWDLADAPLDIAMLEDSPHILISIYSIFGMLSGENGRIAS